MSETTNKPVLFINACVRKESRTKKLADALLTELDRPYEEIDLNKISFPVADEDFINTRDRHIADKDFDDPVFDPAKKFAAADTIVIATPYWDLSFPASLKQFIEQINVVDICFRYTEDGVPEGLCMAKTLYYVTTAGGDYVPEEYGYGYIKALCQDYYGIQDVRLLEAVGLDIVGADADSILESALSAIPGIVADI